MMTQGRGSTQFQVSYKIKTLIRKIGKPSFRPCAVCQYQLGSFRECRRAPNKGNSKNSSEMLLDLFIAQGILCNKTKISPRPRVQLI